MKKIFTSIVSLIICISTFISVSAANTASGDETNPTVLILNENHESSIYSSHPADYYAFTLTGNRRVLIECKNVLGDYEYKITLSGNGIEPIYTTDRTNNYSMYLNAQLNAGTYYVKVESNLEGTMENGIYNITVFDETRRNGHIINPSDYIFINDNFEESNTDNWLDGFRPHYVYGNKAIESEISGNKYVAFTPVNESQYYIFEAKDVYSTSVLCSEFDIKFTSGSMELHTRQADSNLDVNFKTAGRIRKFAYYLQYYSDGEWNYMLNQSGGWLQLHDVDKWYTIRMTLDVRANKYSIYLEDRDSGELISKVESTSFAEECNHISYYAFSSSDKLCIDNVKIFETTASVNVDGWTYTKIPQIGVRQYDYFNTLSQSEKLWSADKWSLINNVTGVSIDANTGILSVTSEAKPGSVIICASRKYYPWIKSTYLVDIDK